MPDSKPNETTPRSYAAYLAAKKTVDDRALNRQVLDVFRRELAHVPSPKILEIGAGVGTMVARLLDWGIIERADYTLLDVDSESLAHAPRWLGEWAKATGRTASSPTLFAGLSRRTMRFTGPMKRLPLVRHSPPG